MQEQRLKKLRNMDYSMASTLPEAVIDSPQPQLSQQSQPEQPSAPTSAAELPVVPTVPPHQPPPPQSATVVPPLVPQVPSTAQREAQAAEQRPERQGKVASTVQDRPAAKGFQTAKSSFKSSKQSSKTHARAKPSPKSEQSVRSGAGQAAGMTNDESGSGRGLPESFTRLPQLEVSGEEVKQSFAGAVESGKAAPLGNFEHTTFARYGLRLTVSPDIDIAARSCRSHIIFSGNEDRAFEEHAGQSYRACAGVLKACGSLH